VSIDLLYAKYIKGEDDDKEFWGHVAELPKYLGSFVPYLREVMNAIYSNGFFTNLNIEISATEDLHKRFSELVNGLLADNPKVPPYMRAVRFLEQLSAMSVGLPMSNIKTALIAFVRIFFGEEQAEKLKASI